MNIASCAQLLALVNRNVRKREHPQALRPYLDEIQVFARHNHFNILHPILRLPQIFSSDKRAGITLS
jgi:hypothetical protein